MTPVIGGFRRDDNMNGPKRLNEQALLPMHPRYKYPWLRLTVSVAILIGLASRIFLVRDAVSAASTGPSFIEFDSGPVRPIAKSPNGQTLFVANTPNGTLEVFDLASGTPAFSYRVAVGL